MERNYYNGQSDLANFFVGTEVENTPANGKLTLFVVGLQDPYKVMEMAKTYLCSHIYFGANQSFRSAGVNDYETWDDWEDMISSCITAGYWATLDIDVSDVEGLVESGLCEYRKFIPNISVKIPYLNLLNYNATIKIDDVDFDSTNPGVWCHQLRNLTTTESFTDWDEYNKDEFVS